MSNEFKQTLRFVALIATPLCLVNSFVFSTGADNFLSEWFYRFLLNYIITFPQAIFYVSIVKRFEKRKQI